MEDVCDIRKIIASEKELNREALGTRLYFFGRVIENGRKFKTFCEKEIAELLWKQSSRKDSKIIFITIIIIKIELKLLL